MSNVQNTFVLAVSPSSDAKCNPSKSALVTHLARADGAYNVTPDGVAIDGFDTVAYFTDDEAVAGDPAFAHEWGGTTWLFASVENRDLFAGDPEAYALSGGEHAAEVEPATAWSIVDGKLYLNWNEQVKRQWASGMGWRITRGEVHGQTVEGQVADGAATFSRKPDSPWLAQGG